MEPVIQKLRGALGGFNRRDVLSYIEQISVAHRREVMELKKELSRCEGERQALEDTLAGLENEKGCVAAEEARVRASLEESTAVLTQLRGELEDTESKLAAARAELDHLREEVNDLSPMAKSYEELKDRVATVELDAHRAAQATVDEAKAEAERLRQETRQWVEDVMAQYSRVRGAVDEVLGHARAIAAMEEQVRQADDCAVHLREQIEN